MADTENPPLVARRRNRVRQGRAVRVPVSRFRGQIKSPQPGIMWKDVSTTDIKTIEAWWDKNPESIPGIDLPEVRASRG